MTYKKPKTKAEDRLSNHEYMFQAADTMHIMIGKHMNGITAVII